MKLLLKFRRLSISFSFYKEQIKITNNNELVTQSSCFFLTNGWQSCNKLKQANSWGACLLLYYLANAFHILITTLSLWSTFFRLRIVFAVNLRVKFVPNLKGILLNSFVYFPFSLLLFNRFNCSLNTEKSKRKLFGLCSKCQWNFRS